MDSTGESFEAIRAVLADRNNILTVKDPRIGRCLPLRLLQLGAF